MGCRNTLTDAQLQVMFSTTDEEMQRIKQPMDWPIERTKHKCKKCVRFFSNETALKQHHFELPFKKKKFHKPKHQDGSDCYVPLKGFQVL